MSETSKNPDVAVSPLLIAQHGRYKREYTKAVMRTAFNVFGFRDEAE
jgi:hypothetical protein